jgi:hypothetical protein
MTIQVQRFDGSPSSPRLPRSARVTHNVQDLRSALRAYWDAQSMREDQAAYHEILLFGGRDGWKDKSWRTVVARWLRCAALRIESR